MVSRLIGSELEAALARVPSWTFKENSRTMIERKFTFTDFKQCWSFMNRVADYAERVQHHPEWFNVYNRVEIVLSTHDAGGLSQKDIDAALEIDKYAAEA